MLTRFLAISLMLALSACAGMNREEAEFSPWHLPDDTPHEVVQMLRGHYGEKSFAMQVRLSLTENKMQVAGLDALGRRAFDILWDENGVQSMRADWVPEGLNALDILKVIVAVYWPKDDPMQARVADRTADLAIDYQSDRAHAWNETTEIRDPKSNYEMTIISYELKQ
ncbi:MAG: DUF3261 domain-containing protein [Alphaproteobacteria bacterium]|nr:MAG: DUF3261 domain-containing protein [Alphaproteobacteria bacterium]